MSDTFTRPHESASGTWQGAELHALFGVEVAWPVARVTAAPDHVPAVDPHYAFHPETTQAVLLGFAKGRRVYLHGPHGSGKSSHVEQVAARLGWPCLRINLDGHITRADLIGRDMVVLKDGKQVTEFVPGLLVWAMQQPMAVIFDEYDAGRPDVMFVIQRLLESQGRLTLLDQNREITPHPLFRLFATGNTAGQGDTSGLYVGTQALNQAQMDRWQVVVEVDYLPAEREQAVLTRKLPQLDAEVAAAMVRWAQLCRRAQRQGDLSVLVSTRTLLSWAENFADLGDLDQALRWSVLNRCDEVERPLLAELFQRCFGRNLVLPQPIQGGLY